MDEADVIVQERCSSLLGSVTMMLWPKTVPDTDSGTMSCSGRTSAPVASRVEQRFSHQLHESRLRDSPAAACGGADEGRQLGDSRTAWDIVPYPYGEIRDLLVKGESAVWDQHPLARYGQQTWGKQELSAQIQL